MRLSAPIFRLKSQAKALAKSNGLPLHRALDQVASREGFTSWSHLAAKHSNWAQQRGVLSQLRAGDLTLIAARPMQGKTLLGLEILSNAALDGRFSAFFSLEYTRQEVLDRIKRIGLLKEPQHELIRIDTSDEICADHVIKTLKQNSEPGVAVIDFLQLLDQNRSKPPVNDQLEDLRKFARQTGSIIAILSQIDRKFESRNKQLPALNDVRVTNPIDFSKFSSTCFLHGEHIAIKRTSPPL